uniref:Uncharacterized protein n=1 Tax=Pipistrellus kuhlii TaxID=59472 RepID=A0A7J7TA59_PIPKU|nr:hypothetical protein mPipKuh1_009668 [Pipistrellus kuhlii]
MGPSSPASATMAARTPHSLALRVPPARDGAGGKVWEGRSPKLPCGPHGRQPEAAPGGLDSRQPGLTAQPGPRLRMILHQLPGRRGCWLSRTQLSPAGLGASGPGSPAPPDLPLVRRGGRQPEREPVLGASHIPAPRSRAPGSDPQRAGSSRRARLGDRGCGPSHRPSGDWLLCAPFAP